jgi:hypothetical protein
VSRRGNALFFGVGRTFQAEEKYGRTTGRNSFFRIGNFLYAFGKSKNSNNPGENVSLAPNDSGAPILDTETNRVIALASKTTVSVTLDTWIPAVSIGTVLNTASNIEFLKQFGVQFE